jgi:multicomponent Na+:H+ antiporter subunit D
MTAGFVSKWFLIEGAMQKGHWSLALVALLGSMLALIYVWRLLEIIWLKPQLDPKRVLREAPPTMLIPMWILAALGLVFGIDATWTAESARAAAHVVLQGATTP